MGAMMKKLALSIVALALIALAGAPAAHAAADGKALYDAKCAMCHGKDGVAKPMAKGSANFNDAKWQAGMTADKIVAVMESGKGKMPKYQGKITPEEMKAIADYVKTIK
jgi:mono/diheme cytochrome c family protein